MLDAGCFAGEAASNTPESPVTDSSLAATDSTEERTFEEDAADGVLAPPPLLPPKLDCDVVVEFGVDKSAAETIPLLLLRSQMDGGLLHSSTKLEAAVAFVVGLTEDLEFDDAAGVIASPMLVTDWWFAIGDW